MVFTLAVQPIQTARKPRPSRLGAIAALLISLWCLLLAPSSRRSSYTEGDLELWEQTIARSPTAAGVDPIDTVQNTYAYGLFTGGLGFHQGAEALGSAVIPTSSGGTQRQVELVSDLESDVLARTSSYALYLTETAEEMGYDPRELPISVIAHGAETCTEPMCEEIEEALGAISISNYRLSEIIGPGSPPSVTKHRTACTSGKVTIIPRSSTHAPAAWPRCTTTSVRVAGR